MLDPQQSEAAEDCADGEAVHREPATSVRTPILVLCCSVSFVLYLHRYAWGFIKKDVQQEFGWDTVELGWMDGLFTASYAAAQIPSGVLCDWFGARSLLGTIIIFWSLALGSLALAKSSLQMAAARLMFGVAQAGCYPALNKVTKNWFPLSVRSTNQGWIATFSGRGGGAASFILFGTVLVGWLGLPWRGAVGVFTLLGVVVGVVFLWLFRNSPEEHPRSNAAEAELITEEDPFAACATGSHVRWRLLLVNRTVYFLFLRTIASNMADVLFVYWVPLYLRTEKGVDTIASGWMAALPLLGGALGGLTSGRLQSHLIRRMGWRRWGRGAVGMAGKLIAAALIWACAAPHTALTVSCVFMAVKFFSDWEQPAEWGTITDIAGRSAATVTACVNSVGALGGFIASPLTGLVLKSFSEGEQVTAAGWNAVFLLIALEYVVAASTWLFIDCNRSLDVAPAENV
jgi:ACS family glucarate transporter-like MFS transporter